MSRSCLSRIYSLSQLSLPRTCISPSVPLFNLTKQTVHRSNRLASTMAHIPPAEIKVQGPHNTTEPDHESHLQTQLESISRNVTRLLIDEDTPSDAEWAILGAHLNNVEELELKSGFNEELNDKCIPRHWPLKKLQLNSACGELVQSPFIRQGIVHHLSLYFTCNLRFEGPTSDELVRKSEEELAQKKNDDGENPNKINGIKIFNIPELAVTHMHKVYSNTDRKLDPENEPPTGAINLTTLEVWENDAMDTFCRFSGALPHIVDNLHTLRLRSTSGLDFSMIDEKNFRRLLPSLANLKVLNYTVGDVFEDPSFLTEMHKLFPPNLTTLYFRAPASLATSEQWPNWLRAFSSREFLPHLENTAFVLDLHYEDQTEESWGKREGPAPLGLLHQARLECETLYDILRERGVNIVRMPLEPEFVLLRPVDPRWGLIRVLNISNPIVTRGLHVVQLPLHLPLTVNSRWDGPRQSSGKTQPNLL